MTVIQLNQKATFYRSRKEVKWTWIVYCSVYGVRTLVNEYPVLNNKNDKYSNTVEAAPW